MESVRFEWCEFQSDFTGGFENYLETEELSDVVIGTDDGSQINAHRIVLSIGSEYFRKIFKMMPENHFVYLPDIDSGGLKNVLKLIYTGQVCILKADVDEFSYTAKYLKLKEYKNVDSDSDIDVMSFKDSPTILRKRLIQDMEELDKSTSSQHSKPKKKSKRVTFQDDLNGESSDEGLKMEPVARKRCKFRDIRQWLSDDSNSETSYHSCSSIDLIT